MLCVTPVKPRTVHNQCITSAKPPLTPAKPPVQCVHLALAALSKLLRGTKLLTNDIKELASALIKHQVTYFSL